MPLHYVQNSKYLEAVPRYIRTMSVRQTSDPFQNASRLAQGQLPEDIDISHRNTLDALLLTPAWSSLRPHFVSSDDGKESAAAAAAVLERCIAAWHAQPAWADVAPALAQLRARLPDCDVLVHANGTTRLQLDLARSSGLRGSFDEMLSSELLGVLKPAPESYARCAQLLRRSGRPDECVMVAAHAYDTRGAKAAGWRTVYVYRWTDDVREDQAVVRREHDVYLEGMQGLVEALEGLGRE